MTWANLYERDGVVVGRQVTEGLGDESGYFVIADTDFQRFKVTLFPTDEGTVSVGLSGPLASRSDRLAEFTHDLHTYCSAEDILTVGDGGLLTAMAKPLYCGLDMRAGFTVQLPADAVPALRFAIAAAFAEAKSKADRKAAHTPGIGESK